MAFARVLSQMVDEAEVINLTYRCDHGHMIKECLVCIKMPNECDWGSCTRKATTTIDKRPTCPHCVNMATDIVRGRALLNQ